MIINKVILIIVLVAVSAFLLGFFTSYRISGEAVKVEEDNHYSWTSAICNEKNECIDILIYCNNGYVEKMTPVSNLIKFNISWIDERDLNNSGYCL